LLEPPAIRAAEISGDRTARLALQEESRFLPIGAVWDRFCETEGVPVGGDWLAEVERHQKTVLAHRK
jgi:L-rhamnose isomerase